LRRIGLEAAFADKPFVDGEGSAVQCSG
jgi:hypothetical protein